MHQHLSTWQFIQNSFEQEIGVMLLYVLKSKGSSPGRQGFCMAVNANGEICGSLGGGIMEFKFVELAKTTLRQTVLEKSVHLQLHDKKASKNQSGMICSGEQTIFLYTLRANDRRAVTSLIESLQQNKNGTLQISPGGIFFREDIPLKDFAFEAKTNEDFFYLEKTGYKNHLYIIGGGHCALALSQLMSNMDFYIHLLDDRPVLNTVEQNHFIHERSLVEDYSGLAGMIPSGKNIYVVIMTVGYRTDQMALKALLDKDFKYLGLLGSTFKTRKMLNDLREEGIAPGILEKVHAPIGLPIKSQTPEEIAVSIAAEIILVKNEQIA